MLLLNTIFPDLSEKENEKERKKGPVLFGQPKFDGMLASLSRSFSFGDVGWSKVDIVMRDDR